VGVQEHQEKSVSSLRHLILTQKVIKNDVNNKKVTKIGQKSENRKSEKIKKMQKVIKS